jgi:ESCRT-II complex subunit VPS36
MGIERDIHKRHQSADQQVSAAFRDIDALIAKARPMVEMLNKYAKTIEEKKGSLTDDETVAFKSALLSVGIANPVTRETHGSTTSYHTELARQMASFLEKPLQESGGIMTLADVYCRYNRARGFDLVSPDDVVNSCRMFESLRLPMRLRQFDSGVLVVQSMVHGEEAVVRDTLKLIEEHGNLTADQLSRLAKISVILATER